MGTPTEDPLPVDHQLALAEAAAWLVDQGLEDVCAAAEADWDVDQSYLAEHLPRKHLHAYTPLFARRFLVCVVTVGGKLAQPHPPALSCVAEELALRAIIAEAGRMLEERGVAADFGPLEDLLFEDTDFETLFDPSLDGIDESPAGRVLGMGPLGVHHWFEPFSPPRLAVHPYLRDARLASPGE